MIKATHTTTAIAVSIPFLATPLGLFGLVGAVVPDWDLKLGIKHRTITHSLLFLFITSLMIYFLDKEISLIYFVSYLSHLILDSCTKHGVPFLYPFSKKTYGLKKYRTGGTEDLLILIISISILAQIFSNS